MKNAVSNPDIALSFMFRSLKLLEQRGMIYSNDRILVVFAGEFDQKVFKALGYTNCLFSDLNQQGGEEGEILQVDAKQLPFDTESFDCVVAHAGIHHTTRPHQVVCEMYRVARKTVVFFESQDSLVMRMAVKAGFAGEYEINRTLLQGGKGGADDTQLPNYVFRWTRREVEKLVRSVDPARCPRIIYFKEWAVSTHLYNLMDRMALFRNFLPDSTRAALVSSTQKVVNVILGWQGNALCACIQKGSSTLHPWIQAKGTEFVVNPEKAMEKRVSIGASRGE